MGFVKLEYILNNSDNVMVELIESNQNVEEDHYAIFEQRDASNR